MFSSDKEIILALVTSSCLMIFLVGIIVTAIIKYQNKSRNYIKEMSDLKIKFQEETIQVQFETEEQTLLRISQEIHDNIGQILSLVKLNLNTCDLEDCSPDFKNKIVTTKNLVSKAITDLRQLSKSLNSQHLSRSYLSEALGHELNIINKTGIYSTEIKINGEERTIDPQKQLIIFRISQEVLNNIIKHAKATNIEVTLDYDTEFLNMVIRDNGIGFDMPINETGLSNRGNGLGNIYHRIKVIGGKADIKSERNKGTAVELNIPIE